MTQAEQIITNIIREMQNRVLENWRGHERTLLIELVRSLDHIAFAFTLAPNRVDLRRQDVARNYMLLGAATALSPSLKVLANDPGGVPWGPSTEQLADFADKYLLNCGYLAHLRRIVNLERYGLASTTFVRNDYLVIEVTADTEEAADRESGSWLCARESEADSAETDALVTQKDHIAQRLDSYIDVDQDWFVRYDSDADLQSYHRELAMVRARRFSEAEALPGDVLLGGRSFRSWSDASVAAQSRVLHHIACSTRLMATRPGLELRNLLTVFARKEDIAAVWRESGESPEWINPLISFMTLDAATSAACEADHEVPLPFYIDFGRDFVLLPSFGALLNPCAGLVHRLKKEFRRDWDRGVDDREAVFRNDLRRVFPAPRFEVPDRGFRIRRQDGSELTDVDAVILDHKTGSLALVQLKWHDIFGRSLKERNSRKLNLLKANEWVSRVAEWIDGRSAADVTSSLNLGAAAKERAPQLFVLARYSARFTGKDMFDQRAAWFGWAEFVNMLSNVSEEDPLSALSRKFQGGGVPTDDDHNPPETFHLPGLTVEVRVG